MQMGAGQERAEQRLREIQKLGSRTDQRLDALLDILVKNGAITANDVKVVKRIVG